MSVWVRSTVLAESPLPEASGVSRTSTGALGLCRELSKSEAESRRKSGGVAERGGLPLGAD